MKFLKYFSYRTAFVRGNTTFFPRDLMNKFEGEIAVISGTNAGNEEHKHVPNHTCYKVELHHSVRYIMFTDSIMIVGTEIEERRW